MKIYYSNSRLKSFANISRHYFAAFILLLSVQLSFISKSEAQATAKLSVQLLLNENGGSNNTADGITALFNNNFSTAIGIEDALKLDNPDENVAIKRNGKMLSIEGRPVITSNDTVPLDIWQFRQKDYFLQIDASNFPATTTAILKDAYTKKDFAINLSGSVFIPFAISDDTASYAANRFCVVFAKASLLAITGTNFKAYQRDNSIQLLWSSPDQTNICRYEIEKSRNGQAFTELKTLLINGDNSSGEYAFYDAAPYVQNNYYRIKAVDKTGAFSYTQVIKLIFDNEQKSLTVFPNPVQGNMINLQLQNLDNGNYIVNLYNLNGQKLFGKTISYQGGLSNQVISPDSRMPKGVYNLQLSKGDVLINEKVIIQ